MRQYIPIRLASVRLDCGVGCGSVGLSEVAVTGVCDVDSTRGIGGDELNRDGLGLNIAFVAILAGLGISVTLLSARYDLWRPAQLEMTP